mmetsp:Transcript_23316/g.23245  ORF Transcript_23316/g.23245 Transcript_23316/m.23245 type:complete len:99 (-) Transcript_23316:167-463(-)
MEVSVLNNPHKLYPRDDIKKFKFKDVGKIHLDETDRPSASFLTPTRNRNKIARYVDEADSPSILMPDNPVTLNLNFEKQGIITKLRKCKNQSVEGSHS